FLENLPEHLSDTKVFTMKMEILLEPTSNKLLVVLSALRRSGNENKQAWYSIYTVKRLVSAKTKSYYQAFNVKLLFGEIKQNYYYQQECKTVSRNDASAGIKIFSRNKVLYQQEPRVPTGSRTLNFSLTNGSEDEVSLSQDTVHVDYSQAKEGTFKNLLIWAQNKKNDVRVKIDGIRTRKGWNFPSCGGEKCKKGVVRKEGNSLVAADEDVGLAYADDVGLPRALTNIIGTTQTMEIKTYTYYEHELRLMASGHERDGTSHLVVVRNVRKVLCGRREVSGVRRVTGLLSIQS
nr:hypothetical protein [Tanacetum cinerariifolium]